MQQQTTKYPGTAAILTQIWKFSVHVGKTLRPKRKLGLHAWQKLR